MLSDKEMALDALEMAKAGATELTKAASECSNQALRQSLLQMRGACETSQQQLGNMAITNKWYMPAAPANPNDTRQVVQFYSQENVTPKFDVNTMLKQNQPNPLM